MLEKQFKTFSIIVNDNPIIVYLMLSFLHKFMEGKSLSLFENYPNGFVHLNLHTQYSMLDSTIKINQLVERINKWGMPAVAQTDNGCMFGAIDFYQSCINSDIKPILGSEVYITPDDYKTVPIFKKTNITASQDSQEIGNNIFRLILLCKDHSGYKNLCNLLSEAYVNGFYHQPRIDLNLLKKYSHGLICTTSSLQGLINYYLLNNLDDKAIKYLEVLYDIFDENLYLEIQRTGYSVQNQLNDKLLSISNKYKLSIVATNNVHYLDHSDSHAHEILKCISKGYVYGDKEYISMETSELYLKSPQQMRELFSDLPEACDNTLKIADKCNIEFNWKDKNDQQIYHLPNFPIDTNESVEDFFKRISKEGLERRFKSVVFKEKLSKINWESEILPKYRNRLVSELDMITKMGFAGYFLIVWDFIYWAKKQGIAVGPGRGSGAGSLVAYSLGITNIDPIEYGLLFERFINPERITMPDFDIDFCPTGRGKIIEYVSSKYGEDKVSQIITYGKLQAKAVIKDVSRALGLAFNEADMISKLIPDELGITLSKALDKEPKLRELMERDSKIAEIFDISLRLEGLIRHASIHAAGVIITNKPLTEYCPLAVGRDNETMVQYDKDFSEKIGLVKFDFLGLKTLTLIDNASKLVRKNYNIDFNIDEIDLNDKNVYGLISKGKTNGIFQIESKGMMDLCKRLRPNNLNDIAVINGLYRPGPLESGMTDEFVNIKNGVKKQSYIFPQLEEALKDTYGVIVYQDQVMHISRVIAGYSIGEADVLRWAMGKKKLEEMKNQRNVFIKQACERGFDRKKTEELYDLMAEFGAYGFNKAHSVAYGLITYQTAFLKHYYPVEFYVSLLSTEISNTNKISLYIKDAIENGIEILGVDINKSNWNFSSEKSAIRFAMGGVKNVGKSATIAITKEREENGFFKSFSNFCNRISPKVVGRRVIESLIRVGAFDECEKLNRRTLIENIEVFIKHGQKIQEDMSIGQTSLFSQKDRAITANNDLNIREFEDYDESEKYRFEVQYMGIHTSGHPMQEYKDSLYDMRIPFISKLSESMRNSSQSKIAGIITSIRKIITKKGQPMGFITLEDFTASIDAIIFPKVFKEYEELLYSDLPMLMTGRIDVDNNEFKFFPHIIEKLDDKIEEYVKGVKVHINVNNLSEEQLYKCQEIIGEFKGNRPISLIFEDNNVEGRMILGKKYYITPDIELLKNINKVLNSNCASFIF